MLTNWFFTNRAFLQIPRTEDFLLTKVPGASLGPESSGQHAGAAMNGNGSLGLAALWGGAAEGRGRGGAL